MDTPTPPVPPYTMSAYVEAYDQWNLNDPSNGITNFRGYDNRHNSFTLSNAVLDAGWDDGAAVGRVALQVGSTPSTYAAGEPSVAGAGGANASGPDLWKHLQQAYAGYHFGGKDGVLLTAGLYLSPIGAEGIAIKDQWNWSRSNLFFALPAYHSGVRASMPLNEHWTLTLHLCNGWNDVVDNNDAKSYGAMVTYAVTDLTVNGMYMTGIERPEGAAEGRAWRHLLDVNATWNATPSLAFIAHADAGMEPNDFGTSRWMAGALYGRYQLIEPLFIALRADFFQETVASDGGGSASPIFWPVEWVASGTATLDFRPADHVSFRLEFRHDQAEGDMYFGGTVTGDGTTTPYLANRDSQDTVTLGATTWF